MTYNESKKLVMEFAPSMTKITKHSVFDGNIPSKIANILIYFLSGKSLNRFEAETINDHCLNTTISTLSNIHQIKIDRIREKVPCLEGRAQVSVTRYWLCTDEQNILAARQLLANLLRQRNRQSGGHHGTR